MKIVFVISCAFLLVAQAPNERLLVWGQAFQTLNSQIREQAILPDSAQLCFQTIVAAFRQETDSLRLAWCADSLRFVFPVKGYSARQIGGQGSGYRPRGFNWFDHSVQGSHPAHDIFVYDRDQDNLDDQTEQPVDVLAMRAGVVVAIENNWQPESEYRGGNFVWIYDPVRDGLFYYAHNSCVVVQTGEIVQAGQKIAEVGRTGFNAAKPRSGTHLHLMYLQLLPNGLPEPQNTYDWLLMAE
ncbi:MAG: M23 family metallopeptidase [Runella slithyformis]|nr:MAG: M23 family metallopeptidase [Runella slithyformis]